ncbi:MCM DNA helicase complex subunit [Zygosaccharomyces mellis]|uniref:DNA replication licensing factor MCM2 n=1 Tax=Zygosaccharomyces mellis TaxID=42258 RepID=A0A4C2ECS8_9SACH|nr:MCM DNA helicase complex subunit [Zygosaccharomyces mellis]
MADNRRRRRENDEDSDSDNEIPPSSPQPLGRAAYDTVSSPIGAPGSDGIENPEGEDEEIHENPDLDELEEQMNEVDLMGDDMYGDYEADPERDRYDETHVDDTEQQELSHADRRRIDAQLNQRDRLLKDGVYMDDDDEAGATQLDEMGLPIQRRRRRRQYEGVDADDDLLDDMEVDPLTEELTLESLSNVKANSYAEWITQPNVSRTIARELKSFLLEYTDETGRSVYGARIRALGETNSESLEVNYRHLAESKAILALFLAKCPSEMLKIFDLVAMEATELHYPDYARIHSEIHVRISDFPTIHNLRELREANLNTLVRVTGVVTRRTGVFPQLKYVKFNCLKCGSILGPFFQDSNEEIRISFCTNCRSKGPFTVNGEKTVYRNYQRITLQEAPGTVPAGRLPRHREVILLADLVDISKPGEEVEVTGIYKNNYDGNLNAKNGFPVFATILEANSIKRREGNALNDDEEGLDVFSWTEEEEREFRKMSRDRTIIDKIISSMAPSIFGHRDIKTAIACSLFGGVPKNVNGKHAIRGDINILLLGDPGTAKSQILKYAEKTAHRAVFTTGQGASAVGLTASVRKDPITKEWTLEGGALVLADKGICLIDEFDKMNDQDRTSIHEAMEQQSISISKAGIVTSLQARCSILAAANPNGGRYNSTLPLAQNVNLTEPILSRFDVLCVVRDFVDEESDERLAAFVVDSHVRSHPENDPDELDRQHGDDADAMKNDDHDDEGYEYLTARQRRLQRQRKKEEEVSPIPQELLIKYIHYARTKIMPKLHQMDMNKVSRVYADLRRESISTGSFPITVRHLESILRIAESFAKMRLSEFVSSWDLDRAIKVVVDSFVDAQKISVRRQLQRSFAIYTLDHH